MIVQEIKYVTGLLVALAIMCGAGVITIVCTWQFGVMWSLVSGISVGLLCFKFVWLPCLRRPIREPNSVLEEKPPEWWSPFIH